MLHVVESYGGGVQNAIHDYIARTDHCDHVILASLRPGYDTGSNTAAGSYRLIDLPRRPVGAMRVLRKAVADLDPDIIHAHSSIAGGLVRVTPGMPTDRIVYTPHCYAFERRDVGRAVRAAYWALERLLARRTGLVVACSPRELDLARRLGIKGAYVPNIADVAAVDVELAPEPGGRTEIVAVGRLAAQKDPQFFADLASAFASRHPDLDVQFTWLGGGNDDRVQSLEDAGVEVSGWLPRAEILQRLAAADAYVHTALWEGAPLTLIEAAALGVPMVVRESPSVASLGLSALVDSPKGAADQLRAVLTGGFEGAGAGADLRARHSAASQRVALHSAYAEVLPAPARVATPVAPV